MMIEVPQMEFKQLSLAFLIVAGVAAAVSGQASTPELDGVDKTTPTRSQRQPEEKQVAQVREDRISVDELKRKLDAKEEIVIIDTRKGSAWIGSLVKIKGAIHITLDELEAKMNEFPRDKQIVAYCT